MSKTSSAVVCETNQIQGQNQENVFFHSLFRVPEEFTSSYVRSAKSTAPIQICACLSAQGEDTLSAMTLQKVLEKMRELTAQTQLMSVLDYESFTTQLVNVLNNTVCHESISHNGAKIRVSMSMVIIEGDTLRVLNIGNTRVWLFRQGKLISLTENQTVAHRYVQMGAIPKEEEYRHEGRNELTQYLGRFAQDGEVLPDKKVHLKLQDGDEIVMLGTGLDQGLPIQKLGVVIARPTQPETKATEIISYAMDNGVKAGLTALVMRIDSTLLLPGDADIVQAAVTNDLSVAPKKVVPEAPPAAPVPPVPPVSAEDAPTIQSEELRYQMNQAAVKNSLPEEEYYDDEEEDDLYEEPPKARNKEKKENAGKKSAVWKSILIGFFIFLLCGLIGYGGMYVLFNAGHWTGKLKSIPSETTKEKDEENTGRVVYALFDETSLFVEESLDSQVIDTLSRGEAVSLLATNDSFAKVKKENGLMGYVPLEMLSDEDPTKDETMATDFYDPTPIPTSEVIEDTQPPETSPEETSSEETSEETTTESEESSSSEDTSESTSEPMESSSESTSESTSESSSEPTSEPSSESSESSSESSESSSDTQASSEEQNTSEEQSSETPASSEEAQDPDAPSEG